MTALRKYKPLQAHLERRGGRPEILAFEDIERIIGKALPMSATKHRSFWSNDNREEGAASHAWTRAGYRVAYLDREQKVVRFERTR